MVEIRKPMKINEALSKIGKFGGMGNKKYIPIQKCDGFILAEDIIADHHLPPFDRSPYDGFAVRAQDTLHASTNTPKVLRVIGEIGAGTVFPKRVGMSEAVRIMTGAKIPDGCDAVIMLEAVKESTLESQSYVHIRRPVKPNTNISFTGEDTEKGSVLAQKGQYIHPGIVALLATFGYEDVPINARPKVGVIATGSELLEVSESLEPGKIRNSNGYMVSSQIKRAGGKAIYFGKFNDDFTTCLEMVESSLKSVDILITTGGVSVGDYDYMPAVFAKIDANVLFNKVAMRPGSVTTVAEKNGKLIFALSGNPSACYVGFELFARPIIRTYLGIPLPYLKKTYATLGADFLKRNPFDRFVRSKLVIKNGQVIVIPTGLDKSSVISSLAETNAFIVFPGGTSGFKKGMRVQIILLEDQEGISFEEFTLE